jgi:hypothetical protein
LQPRTWRGEFRADPCCKASNPKFDQSNPVFASDLDPLVRPPTALWVHGYTRQSIDATVNGTRIVCDPRGSLPIASRSRDQGRNLHRRIGALIRRMRYPCAPQFIA